MVGLMTDELLPVFPGDEEEGGGGVVIEVPVPRMGTFCCSAGSSRTGSTCTGLPHHSGRRGKTANRLAHRCLEAPATISAARLVDGARSTPQVV